MEHGERPLRATRPYSCLEGKLLDDWLQMQVPAIVDQTTSVPAVPNQTDPETLKYLRHSNCQAKEISLSLAESSQGSLESLQCQSGLEKKERVQIRTSPSPQMARLCSFVPVQFGWLPLQTHVVKKEKQTKTYDHDGATCQVKNANYTTLS